MPQAADKSSHISTLNEQPLHAALKDWYAQPTDRQEVSVDGFIIDIVRGDLLIEIQTGSFSAIKRKLKTLTAHHRVRLVYPIAREKWIVKLDPEGKRLSRRKSPKRGRFEHLFGELVYLPTLLSRPSFSLEVLLIQAEELRQHDPSRAWRRRGWVIQERRLLRVVDRLIIEQPDDLLDLLPPGLPQPFTTADLAAALGQPRRLAQRMAYCLYKMGLIAREGTHGRAILYRRAMEADA